MGKKGQRTRRHTIAVDGDDDPLDEGVSVTSCGTNDTYPSGDFVFQDGGPRSETSSVAGSGVLENDTQAVEDFRDAVDQLSEKRGSTRERALKTVLHFMLHALDLSPVILMHDTILQGLVSVLRRKGSESEAVLALKAISVLCVCIGPEEEEVFRTVRRPLRVLITRSRHSEVRAAAVHTLALACFICSTDEDDTSETLDLLARVFSRTVDGLEVKDNLVVAALSGWGLLATTISRVYVATQMMVQYLRTFRELLASSDMEVRVEAGENLALLHESRLIVGLSYPGDMSFRGGDPPQGAGVADGADGEDDGVSGEGTGEDGDDGDDEAEAERAMELATCWEEVVEEMKGFITESSKKLSRETKKQQRRTFRQLFATIGDNEPPEEVVSLQNGSLTVTDWAHIKQLNALRSCLQSGFQIQMQSNELLREILGVSKWGGTGEEKPFYSKSSWVRKQQTTSRTRSRHSKQVAQDHILSDTELR